MDFATIDTPALLVDLDTMERNQRRMNQLFASKTVRVRPHFKNHRVLVLADLQIASGATGITCARLWQAERLIRHGIRDVLVANEIAGEGMIRKFIELSRIAPVIVGVDNSSTIEEMARRAGPERGALNLVVDFDLGLRRCGVVDAATGLTLARKIVDAGMRFRGVMGHEGHLQPLPPGPEKERVEDLLTARESVSSAHEPVLHCTYDSPPGKAGDPRAARHLSLLWS